MVLLVLLYFWLLLCMCLVIGNPKTYTYLLQQLTLSPIQCFQRGWQNLCVLTLGWHCMKDASITVWLGWQFCALNRYIYIYIYFSLSCSHIEISSWSITCVSELFKLLFFQQQLCRYSCFILSGGISAAGICQLESWFVFSLMCCVLCRWKALSVSALLHNSSGTKVQQECSLARFL